MKEHLKRVEVYLDFELEEEDESGHHADNGDSSLVNSQLSPMGLSPEEGRQSHNL